MAKKLGTTIYYDWVQPLSLIPANDFKPLVLALIAYERGEIDDDQIPKFKSEVAKHSAMFMFPQMSRARANAENGRKGGEATQEKAFGSTVGLTNGSTVGRNIKSSTNTYTYTNTKTNTNTNTITNPSVEIYEEEFEKLWKIYPNKKGKAQALQAYIKARKQGESYEAVENGINSYIQQIHALKTKPEYVKHGSTWFSQNAWNDEYTTGNTGTEHISEADRRLLDCF